MADLAANLFLRELARRDVEKEATRRDESARAEAGARAIEGAERTRDGAFNRQLKAAEAMSKHAAAMGKAAPKFENAAIAEAGDVGRMAGEEVLSGEERKQAAAALKALQEKQMQEYGEGQNTLRRQLQDNEAMKRSQLDEKGRMSRAWMEDRRMRDLAMLQGHKETAARRNKEAEAADLMSAIDNIRKTAVDIDPATGQPRKDAQGNAIVDYEKFLSPQSKNKQEDYWKRSQGSTRALSTEEQGEYSTMAKFRSQIGLTRAVLYKKLIGAGQTGAEAQRLVDSIIQYDMNPIEFASALQTLEEQSIIESGAEKQAGAGYSLKAPGEGATMGERGEGLLGTTWRDIKKALTEKLSPSTRPY